MATIRPARVLELRSVRGTGGGPEKTILMSAAQHNPDAALVTVCYIRDERDDVFGIDRRAKELAVDYVEIKERHSFDPGIWRPLQRLIRDRAIDIVHAHDYKTDLLALLLARSTGAIAMTTLHGWAGDSPRERLYYYVDKKLLRWFPRVLAVSEPIRQTAISYGARPDRVVRVTNAIDPNAFRRDPAGRAAIRASLGIPASAVVVGAVGRLETEKRFDTLLTALAALAGEFDVRGVIAGDGSQREALLAHSASLGIADRVMLLGHREDAREVHRAFDVYAQTSIREGIPNAVLEAMALETPVVATAVGGTSELITEGVHGLLVPPEDLTRLIAALRATIRDSGAAACRVAAARQKIETELSFSSRLATVEQIYAELLTARS